jgi:copper resistance protein D
VVDSALGVARLCQYAATLTLFGSALFFLYGLPAHGDRSVWPRFLLAVAAAVGLVAIYAWLSAEAACLTGAWSAVLEIVAQTRFGKVAVVRGGLLLACLAACLAVRSQRALSITVTALGGIAVASFAWTGHGSIGSNSAGHLHTGADVVHLLSAGIWIGALASLSTRLLCFGSIRNPTDARLVAFGLARFSVVGPGVVAILTLSGAVNVWYMAGPSRWRMLFSSGYGFALLAKLVFFASMLALAAVNRFRLAPRLENVLSMSAPAQSILATLRTSLLTETALALLALAAVAVLGMMEPPVAMD